MSFKTVSYFLVLVFAFSSAPEASAHRRKGPGKEPRAREKLERESMERAEFRQRRVLEQAEISVEEFAAVFERIGAAEPDKGILALDQIMETLIDPNSTPAVRNFIRIYLHVRLKSSDKEFGLFEVEDAVGIVKSATSKDLAYSTELLRETLHEIERSNVDADRAYSQAIEQAVEKQVSSQEGLFIEEELPLLEPLEVNLVELEVIRKPKIPENRVSLITGKSIEELYDQVIQEGPTQVQAALELIHLVRIMPDRARELFALVRATDDIVFSKNKMVREQLKSILSVSAAIEPKTLQLILTQKEVLHEKRSHTSQSLITEAIEYDQFLTDVLIGTKPVARRENIQALGHFISIQGMDLRAVQYAIHIKSRLEKELDSMNRNQSPHPTEDLPRIPGLEENVNILKAYKDFAEDLLHLYAYDPLLFKRFIDHANHTRFFDLFNPARDLPPGIDAKFWAERNEAVLELSRIDGLAPEFIDYLLGRWSEMMEKRTEFDIQ